MNRRTAILGAGSSISGVTMATALMLAAGISRRRPERQKEPKQLTEREVWNAAVDQRKADKRAAKGKA